MNGRTNVIFGSTDSLGGIIPLEPPSNFVVIADNAKCLINWTDPLDKYADELGNVTDEGDQLVSQFALTRIVRKVGSAPSSPTDGDLVTESSLRNQYQSTKYADEGLINNTLYYYAAFTCNTDGVWSGSVIGSATPRPYSPTLSNNTWSQISQAGNEGVAASIWEIGDETQIMLNDEPFTVNLIGFNHDDLADGSGKAAMTFAIKYLTSDTLESMWSDRSYSPMDRIGYSKSGIITLVNSYTYDKMSDDLKREIVTVNKSTHQEIHGQNTGHPDGNIHSIDDEDVSTLSHNAFLFSEIEVCESRRFSYTGEGSQYSYFATNSNRIKQLTTSQTTPVKWMLRSGMGSYSIYSSGTSSALYYSYITTNGNANGYADTTLSGNANFCFGFCIGKTAA